MRSGFGVRHPDVDELLARHCVAAAEDAVWGPLRLRISSFVGSSLPAPDELVTSIRCITRVREGVVVCQAPDQLHVWPGGRRRRGETYADTAAREVHEETGWITDMGGLRLLGLLHMEIQDPQAPDYPYPNPDFLQLVFAAWATERAVGVDDHWADADGRELRSTVVRAGDIASLDLSDVQSVFLRELELEPGSAC